MIITVAFLDVITFVDVQITFTTCSINFLSVHETGGPGGKLRTESLKIVKNNARMTTYISSEAQKKSWFGQRQKFNKK